MSLDNLKVKADAVKDALGEFYDALHEEVSSVVERLENSFETTPATVAPVEPVAPATDTLGGLSNEPSDPNISPRSENEGPQTGAENSIDTETDNSHA